jgi:Rrf2 family protein
MLSQTTVHAIRAFIYLATIQSDSFVGATHLAKTIDAPTNYLSKVLQQLTHQGLLESQRGARGGIRLAKPAATITLFDIAEPIERVSTQAKCFMNKLCCGARPCRHHADWTKLHTDFLNFLKKVNIEDLVKQNQVDHDRFMMPGIRKDED